MKKLQGLTMLKKIIYMCFILSGVLSAATVSTDKEVYTTEQSLSVMFGEMEAQNDDWIGIYPSGTSNDWGNQVQWNWTGDIVEGTLTFPPLPAGTYDIRVFYNNSFELETSKQIVVDNIGEVTSVETTKDIYLVEEEITAIFDNMAVNNNDWIGIYPAGSTNEWSNMLQWEWIRSLKSGTQEFEPMPVGDYEVRVFFNNSFVSEASYAFSVEEDAAEVGVSLSLNKEVYAQNELIYIDYDNMQGNNTDWIGIYPAGASYHFENVIDSKKTYGNISGQISLGGVDGLPDAENNPGGLAPGNYEMRAFYNNTLGAETVVPFTVTSQPVVSTVYEAASGSISPDWIHISGPTAPYYNQGKVSLRPTWISNTNTSEYRLAFPEVNTIQKVLELDAGGLRWLPHFNVGVIVQTLNGTRKMFWDPFFNHQNVNAFKSGNVLSYPLYVDIQRRAATKLHVRLDVEKYLRILEPNNKVVSISSFTATGGDLDEIKLSSH